MARKLGKQNNNASIVKDGLEKMNLSFVLGRSNAENTLVENSPEGDNDFTNNAGFAQRITSSNIKTVYKFSSEERKYLNVGNTIPHQYFSSGESNGQFLFVQDGILYMVIGHPGINNRTDLMGSQVINNSFTRKDGGIGEVDGIQYIAVNALPNDFDQLSGNYVEISLIQNEINKLNGATSKVVQAKNICGAGNELRTGNCCLYYSEAGYDSVSGVTYDAGDFYKCLCTKCYRCADMADALDMKYVFQQHEGGTGTTGGTGATGPACLGCESEDFPTDCGPCGCTVDWNQTSHYTSILNNPDISTTSSVGRNVSILDYHAENLSGAILSANINLKNLTWEQRMLSSSYESNVKDGTLYLPIQAGGIKSEAVIAISTVYDSSLGRYIIDGLKSPKINGEGYTSAVVDEGVWSDYFPDWPTEDINNRFKINITPIGGIPSNIENIIDLSCLIHVVVTSKNISDTFAMKEFDWYSISELKDESGASLYSGHGEVQTDYKSLVTEVSVSPVTGSFSSISPKPLEKEYVVNGKSSTTIGNKNKFNDTSINFIVPYDATYIEPSEMIVPIQSAYPADLIGTTISSVEEIGSSSIKVHMNVDSISYRPESSSGTGHYYDPSKTKMLVRNPVTINLNQNPANIKTFAFEILWGTQTHGIST